MHAEIAAFIQQRFRTANRLGYDAPLFSTGIVDSFGVLELIAFLEEAFTVDINPARHDLLEFDTINKIVQVVSAAPRLR
jgi:acyl carrier protein